MDKDQETGMKSVTTVESWDAPLDVEGIRLIQQSRQWKKKSYDKRIINHAWAEAIS